MSLVKPKRGDEIRLEISGSAFEGKAVARINGLVVFVEGGVPGDVVNVLIVRTKRNHAEARIKEILSPSSFRTAPRCKHFGTCGGCTWQHVDYKAQLLFKRQHVLDSFQRIGGFESIEVPPVIGADDIYFYRNKMEFSFSDQEWVEEYQKADIKGRKGSSASSNSKPETWNPKLPLFLGLHVPQRYDKVLDLRECHLQSETSHRIVSFVRDDAKRRNLPAFSSVTGEGYLRFLVIRQSKRTDDLMVNLVTFDDRPDVMRSITRDLTEEIPGITTIVNTINSRKAQIALGDREVVYTGEGVIREKLGKFTFDISASSFFQTNTEQAERLYTVAKEFAGLSGSETVFDLYSGTGTIAIVLSEAAGKVVGIESAESAIRDAEHNVKANRIANCSFVLGDLKDRLTKDADWMKLFPAPDVLVIDPPRSGMHPKVVEAIGKLGVSRVVYVSCNPATQARDAKLLSERYKLVKLQPVDMFPHTYHIENVALLELR